MKRERESCRHYSDLSRAARVKKLVEDGKLTSPDDSFCDWKAPVYGDVLHGQQVSCSGPDIQIVRTSAQLCNQ